MSDKFEYRVVNYRTVNRPQNETVAEGVEKLLNNNGLNGWELVQFEDDAEGVRWLWLKRRFSN
jgi:hypothetical protein